MIKYLIHASLKARWLVVVLACIVLALGIYSATKAPIDAFPEFAPPMVEVQTEAPGLSSLEVEQLVTTPIESVLAGTSFTTTVRSKSVLGLSSVVMLFQPGTDLFVARQMVQERLVRAQALLPVSAHAPVMLSPLSSTSRAMKIGLTSTVLSQTELTDLVRFTVRPRLLAIAGVANVAVWGARNREFTVRMDPARMDALNVSSDELQRALQGATSPLPGGFLDGPIQRIPVRQQTTLGSTDDIANIAVVSRGGSAVRVGDLSTVVNRFSPPIGDAVINDQPGLLLIVEKQPWGNTLEITRQVDLALAALAPAMPNVAVDPFIFRPAAFIERSISNLERAMILGCVLVILVLLLFLWSWRTALISAVALPLSLSAAVAVLHASGATLNTMVLAGLVIALGEVVDDAIIDVENILRRMRENHLLASPKPSIQVALSASLEVRGTVVNATVIVVLVFLPVWFMGGVAGAFFRPLAMAYALGVLASMLVALTVTPALSLILLPKMTQADSHSPLMRVLQERFARLLPLWIGRPKLVAFVALVVLSVGAVGFSLLKDSFLPEFKESDFLMHWVAQPGTSLPALQRTTVRISRDLRAIPGVHSFGSHLGRAESGDEVVGPNFAELWVHADATQNHELTEARIRAAIAPYPGLRRDAETYLRERVGEVITGTTGSIVVRVAGPNLASLRSGADLIAQRIRTLRGVSRVQVESQALVPELSIEPRPEAVALGFVPAEIRRSVTLLLRGERVGESVRDGRSIPVVLRGPDSTVEDISWLADTLLVSATGSHARLGALTTLTLNPTPNLIAHEAGSRRINISITVSGALGPTAALVQQAVSSVALPVGHYTEVLGEWRERQNAKNRLVWLSLASFVLILAVLFNDLKSARKTLLVASTLPFALVGGIAGCWVTGGVLSLGSLVGLVTVLGIASRNGIMLVGHYRQLESEGHLFGPSLVVRATAERLGPILMTALATALALVPIVLSGDQPGHEIEHPMAVVILGGLISSTLLNLALLPTLYLRFGQSNLLENNPDELKKEW